MAYNDFRIKEMANLMISRGLTVRQVASIIGVCKSTVHKDVTERLYDIDYDLFLEVRALLDYHKNVRHIRGGESTKRKYMKMKKMPD